jgi:hypothetical protein
MMVPNFSRLLLQMMTSILMVYQVKYYIILYIILRNKIIILGVTVYYVVVSDFGSLMKKPGWWWFENEEWPLKIVMSLIIHHNIIIILIVRSQPTKINGLWENRIHCTILTPNLNLDGWWTDRFIRCSQSITKTNEVTVNRFGPPSGRHHWHTVRLWSCIDPNTSCVRVTKTSIYN